MKVLFIACSLFVLAACGSSEVKEEKKAAPDNTGFYRDGKKIEQTAADKALQTWMQGKVWTAEESMAPMRLLKLKADGECDFYKKPAGPWIIVNSELVLKRLTEWPMEKVDDKTFRIYVAASDTWYMYKHTEDL